MQIHYRRVIWVLMAGFFLAAGATASIAKKPLFEDYKQVIAIDPGHGGDEAGAKGPNGTIEKAVTLSMAQILAADLQRGYRVVLTREDDNQVDLEMRTALANHHKADLLISIHTGGSFVHSASGILIYHYQDFAEVSPQRAENPRIGEPGQSRPILWDRVQDRHLEKSRVLAGLINTRLDRLAVAPQSRVQGAPLRVLQGADMPAIIIEIGYLTNPTEEKKLNDQRYLADLASAIHQGIDEFFKQDPF
jgi:N-acetylmuramoyl-L-alanine amidase